MYQGDEGESSNTKALMEPLEAPHNPLQNEDTDERLGLTPEMKPIAQGQNYGVRVLYNQSTAVVDIVFLHGLTGNAFTTWYHKGIDVHWPSAYLREDIPDARIISFGYDADVSNWWKQASTSRVTNHADDMVGALVRLREETEIEDRKIIFVAHSLGGLVTETALASSRHSSFEHIKQIEKNTVKIVFMGTPHHGADAAKWAAFAASLISAVKQINVKIVQLLKPDSEMLEIVQKSF